MNLGRCQEEKTNKGRFNRNIFYVAAIVLFIVSIISAISGVPSGASLGLGSLFLALGVMHFEKSKDDKDNKLKILRRILVC